jgi:hypothetical protein
MEACHRVCARKVIDRDDQALPHLLSMSMNAQMSSPLRTALLRVKEARTFNQDFGGDTDCAHIYAPNTLICFRDWQQRIGRGAVVSPQPFLTRSVP